MENLIDSDDLSKRLGGVPKSTLDQWAYLGTGPRYVKIGRHRRYDPRDVEAWIESRKHGGDVDAWVERHERGTRTRRT
jgi:predicted DNA-binding transcriptional regulator AlpA